MGNLLCCFDDTSSVTSLIQSESSSHDAEIGNAQRQQNGRDRRILVARESSATEPYLPSSSVGNVVQKQLNSPTKLQPKKAASSATCVKVSVVQSKPGFSNAQKNVPSTQEKHACKACGEIGHLTESCRYFTRLCFHCREEGHINRICPKRSLRSKQKGSRAQQNGTCQVLAREQKHNYNRVQKKTQITKVQQRRPKSIKS